MAGINSIGAKPTTSAQRREKGQQVAADVGAAAAVTTTATKAASKRAMKAESTLNQMMNTVTAANRTATKNAEEVKGLWAAFRANMTQYTNQIMGGFERFKNRRIIGAIIKSPVTKGLTKVLGGALAFFVLVSGVNKAIKTGKIAVDDLQNQLNEFNRSA